MPPWPTWPGSESISTTSWDSELVNCANFDAQPELVGITAKFGVFRPHQWYARVRLPGWLHMLGPLASPKGTDGAAPIFMSGLKMRITCGEGSIPEMWQLESERIVVASMTPLFASCKAASTHSCEAT